MLIACLRQMREAKGLTQGELAAMVGVRRETIVHLERGRYNPSLKLALDIAHVFAVPVETLFQYAEDPETAKQGKNGE